MNSEEIVNHMSGQDGEASRSLASRLVRYGLCICACVAAGLLARVLLLYAADRPRDLSALPHKGLNAPFVTSPDVVVEKMVELGRIAEGDLV